MNKSLFYSNLSRYYGLRAQFSLSFTEASFFNGNPPQFYSFHAPGNRIPWYSGGNFKHKNRLL